ncbi:uncharacterized protein K460DRAFT_342556 [Cucurbitaria berberidis CBS 394.84]|uniref:Uncharacterized protein n=1 Tax=Cucurbitaria berberidis CBS 394.84 TaxID=1168544 RepID=A0A9P4L789_9PLEO|nr:uncharacterized protein K460DRAFT_342556 [Cucurbitaria berberidis CBS 394.84]KAF1843878.1 hypothetical protein K460DRAFT_342556 [Cucurbitaria berberidis CBS 394.84]
MCTKVTLKHSTCQHRFWIKRNCHRHPECALQTDVERERGGECWECDPGQGPPEALFPRDVSWRRIPTRPCGGVVSV